MIVTVDVTSQPRFLAVLVGIVMLLPILEQTTPAFLVVLPDLGRIVARCAAAFLRIARLRHPGDMRASLVSVLARRVAGGSLLNSLVISVFPHRSSSLPFDRGNPHAGR